MKIQAEETAERWAPPWWAVFVVGLLLWGATVAVGRATHNIILLPTIVLLGSFLVPITAVVWYLDHDPSPALSPRRIVTAFLIGGTMGVLGASLLEYWLVNVGLVGAFEVGLIEEFVKGVFIVVVALGISRFHIRDGMVLGATVGFVLAALESSGYALAALFVAPGADERPGAGGAGPRRPGAIWPRNVVGDPWRCDLRRRPSWRAARHLGNPWNFSVRVRAARCVRLPQQHLGSCHRVADRAGSLHLALAARRRRRRPPEATACVG